MQEREGSFVSFERLDKTNEHENKIILLTLLMAQYLARQMAQPMVLHWGELKVHSSVPLSAGPKALKRVQSTGNESRRIHLTHKRRHE